MIAPKLTAEQVRMLQYFHQYKGSVTQWTGWEECIPSLEAHHPEILYAQQAVIMHQCALDALIRALEEPYDE